MLALTRKQVNLAAVDLMEGIAAWRLSRLLAWQDVKQRYRRSTLGPIWLTLSSAVQILTISVVSAFLFGGSIQKSVPFVCTGMLFWGFVTQVITEGSMLFVTTSPYITQVRRPFTIFLSQVILRNLIVLAHNSIIYVVVAIIFRIVPGIGILLWPIGLALVVLCLSWIALFCAIISARYRDVPIIIQNILNIVFWFTPLMYFPEQLGSRRFVADYNPFTHIVALLREPLLGGAPSLNDWLIVLAITILGCIGTFLFFARFRARVVYWL